MKLNTRKTQPTNKQAILLLIIIGIQILYSGYMILMGVVASAGLDIKILVSPAMLFSLGIWAVIKFTISGLMVKLLFSNDTINGFSFTNSSRSSLIIKVSVIVILAIALYFGIGSLLVK